MDVLYDVANLGMSFGTELTRTGIFRVTESFVNEVLAHPDINARFAAMLSANARRIASVEAGKCAALK